MTVHLVLLVGILAVSSASVLIKLCDAPSMVIASYRLTIASLFFLSTSAVRRNNPLADFNRKELTFAVFSGLFLCLHFATWITSLRYTSVANSVVLVSTTPIFVAIGSLLFLKEKISKLLVYGISMTVVGAIILGSSQPRTSENSWLGNVLALSGAIGAAGYFLFGRNLRAQKATVAYVSVVYSTAALIMVLLTILFEFNLTGYTPRNYSLLVAIAIVPQIIGHTSFNWALRYVSATVVAVITLGEPIGASILAFFLLGEKLTALQAIGGMLILIGVALAIRGASNRSQK